MDETGHSGDAGAAESGAGADSRDRPLLNGWSRSDTPWSHADPTPEPEADEVPAWRRSPSEMSPPTRPSLPPEPVSGQFPQFGAEKPPGEVRPFRFGDERVPDPVEPETPGPAAPRWADSRSRYSDLVHHLSPDRTEPLPPSRPDSLGDDDRPRPPRDLLDAPTPSSAPPFPYEGDLDDATPPPVGRQRASVPLERPRTTFPAVRPATPGGRRADWASPESSRAESARHALDPQTPPDPSPRVDRPDDLGASAEPSRSRPSYDPVSYPRRLPYESASPAGSPPADNSTGYAAPTTYSGFAGRSAGDPGAAPADEHTARALPQRVPAEPDVPTVPEPPSVEPPAEAPALARIATHLRRGDVLSPSQERQEGFDVKAILAAVREVDGVRDASLRTTPAGAHSLRLDLAEGADPAEVSRIVARLLQDRMGLDAAAMQGGETPTPTPAPPLPAAPVSSLPDGPPVTAFVPTQAGPSGRAPVSGPAGDDPLGLPTAPQAGRTSAPAQDSPAQSPPAQSPPVQGRAEVGGPTSAPPSAAGSAVETVPSGLECSPPRPLDVGERPGPRVVIENVQVNTFGTEATVEVRLAAGGRTESGVATGPAVDGYLLRLCAMATAQAVDELLAASDHADGPARCFVEHAAAVPFGAMEVAVVVLLLSCGGWVEQLAGSAVVTGDDRHAMVRATLAAVNRRLEALLS